MAGSGFRSREQFMKIPTRVRTRTNVSIRLDRPYRMRNELSSICLKTALTILAHYRRSRRLASHDLRPRGRDKFHLSDRG